MALKIKLTRIGKKNDPKYRIVIAEAKSRRDGQYIDKLGFYNPTITENNITLDVDRMKEWITKGATFTKGTHRLLNKKLK